jgi:hypothetical protein
MARLTFHQFPRLQPTIRRARSNLEIESTAPNLGGS